MKGIKKTIELVQENDYVIEIELTHYPPELSSDAITPPDDGSHDIDRVTLHIEGNQIDVTLFSEELSADLDWEKLNKFTAEKLKTF